MQYKKETVNTPNAAIDLYFNHVSFINDANMMKDCYLLAKDDFLNKYRWISEEEYNNTLERFQFE